MDRAARAGDVCVHVPTGRRCLVVAVCPSGEAECVDGCDESFACRVADLVSYRHPRYDRVLRRAAARR